jgi:hypothetical protein
MTNEVAPERYRCPDDLCDLLHQDAPASREQPQQPEPALLLRHHACPSTPQQHHFALGTEHSRQASYLSSPLPVPSEKQYIHPERCPPLNLEFLWKIYNKRGAEAAPDEGSRFSTWRTHQDRIGTLRAQGFPEGLASLMLQHAVESPLRIFLVDNSGTLHQNDAYLVSQSSSGRFQTVGCTRWESVTSAILWHAGMAAWCQTPMAVRLLHDPGIGVGPQQLGICASKHFSSTEEEARLRNLLRATRPNGGTSPLNAHLQEMLPSISTVVPRLLHEGRRLTLCICTDSIPTDPMGTENPQGVEDFLSTLGKLLDWPVHVVVLLSTREERVVQFYKNCIANPNLATDDSTSGDGLSCGTESSQDQLQVLGDYVSECEKVREHNPWLNYGYPLHLCREEGICINVIEALSQRPLRRDEVLDVVGYLFGPNISDAVPTNETQYHAFRRRIDDMNSESTPLWNPIRKKVVPWIDLKRLDRDFFHHAKTGKQVGGGGNNKRGGNERKCDIM